MNELGTARERMLGQRRNVSAGIAAAAGFLHHHAKGVARMQIRLALTHLVGVQLHPFDADLLAQAPAEIAVEIAARREYVHHAVALDQLGHARFFRELLVQQRRVLQQIAQRKRRLLDPCLGPAREQILDQPGQRLRQVRPADRERAERVHQITRHLLPEARLGRRNHRMGGEPAGIAVARRLFATGLACVDQRDAMPSRSASMALITPTAPAPMIATWRPSDIGYAFTAGAKSLPTEIARGSMMQWRIDGLPEASARSNAGANSSVRSTRSPWPPNAFAYIAKSGFLS